MKLYTHIHYNIQQNNGQVETTLFSGYFPKRPKHTCNNLKVLHATSSNVKLVNYTQKVWRERDWYNNNEFKEHLEVCKGCLYTQVIRQCKQVQCEVDYSPNEDWGYILIPEKEFRLLKNRFDARKNYSKFKATSNKKGNYITKNLEIKYLAIPQEENKLLLFHNTIELEESKSIPLKLDELFQIVYGAVTTMPSNSRVRRSRKFGREYAGKQGYPSQSKDFDIKINIKENIRSLLDTNNIPFKNRRYQINILSLLTLLKENNIKYNITLGKDIIKKARKDAELNKEKEIQQLLWQLNRGVNIEEDTRILMRLEELTGKTI